MILVVLNAAELDDCDKNLIEEKKIPLGGDNN